MRERKEGLIPVSKILKSRCAVIAGSLLTVPRDTNSLHILSQAIVDGVILAMTFGPELNGRPNVGTVGLLLGSRVFFNSLRYMDRRAANRS